MYTSVMCVCSVRMFCNVGYVWYVRTLSVYVTCVMCVYACLDVTRVCIHFCMSVLCVCCVCTLRCGVRRYVMYMFFVCMMCVGIMYVFIMGVVYVCYVRVMYVCVLRMHVCYRCFVCMFCVVRVLRNAKYVCVYVCYVCSARVHEMCKCVFMELVYAGMYVKYV